MIFGFDRNELNSKGAIHTASEIYQQLDTFKKTVDIVKNQKEELHEFLSQVTKNDDFRILLAGAGTSEFVGNSVVHALNEKYFGKVLALSTTDIVSGSDKYVPKDLPTLMVNFARSGNSPESVGTVELSSQVNPNLKHLYITCNVEGSLAKSTQTNDQAYAIVLSPETNDQSFAMTSSFTNMCLATLLAFDLEHMDKYEKALSVLQEPLEKLRTQDFGVFENIVKEFDFERIVYLGTASLKGMAQESALKMLELTAGKTVTAHNSALGFRHGPKSIINEKTLIVMYFSDDEYARKYELDLLKEVSSQRDGYKILVVASRKNEELQALADYSYFFENETTLQDELLAIEYIHVAQLLALYKSMSYGLTPDNPFPSGTVNRVVKGVVIYK